jgi:ethanolamine kinase
MGMKRKTCRRKLKDAFLKTPSKDEINRLYGEANVFSLLSHYYWGLWGLIQAMVSDIDFDYMEYAVHRFNEYNRRKGSALAYLDI